MPWVAGTLPRIFVGALAIRWIYDIVLFAAMGQAGLMGADSRGYLGNAEIMAVQLMNSRLHGWAWLGSDLGVMPLYPWLVTLNVVLFGGLASLTTVMMQGVIDAGTCLLVYCVAKTVDERIALPAALAAVINPTQIVIAGIIYNDTLFVFFVTLFLAGAVSWLRQPSWQASLTVGIGLGLAALVRIVVAPWVPVMLILLLVIGYVVRILRARQMVQVVVMGALFCMAISPIVARNVTQYGAWALTNQGGSHLALWVVPLVREATDGTPWERGTLAMEQRTRERFGAKAANPFAESQRYASLGREVLRELGVGAIVKAWFIGAAINLAAPAVIVSPPIAQLPRTGFYETVGDSILAKISNFLFHSDNAIYAWALLLGIAGVGAIRLVQLAGLIDLAADRSTWRLVIPLLLWCGFILAANGPVASPKYRLPIEPVLCMLTGAGYALLRRRVRTTKVDHTSA